MMAKTWRKQLIVAITLNLYGLALCSPIDEPDAIVYPEEDVSDNIDKRLSNFVRIGRALSSFVRIGKSSPDFAVYGPEQYSDEDLDSNYEDLSKQSSAFVGDGQDVNKRLSSFVRIGRGGIDNNDYLEPQEKRGGAFIRLGKFPSAAFVRNRSGKIHSISSPPYYRRSGRIGHSSFIRIGKRDTTAALQKMENAGETPTEFENGEQDISAHKRFSKFVRIGKARPDLSEEDMYAVQDDADIYPEEVKRMSKFVRIGKNVGELPKRMSSFVRIGKSSGKFNSPAEKRMSSFVRIGKSDNLDNTADKRMSSFVRIGKSFENMDNLDKRFSKFVRIGKSPENMDNVDKRFSKFVRIGKGLGDDDMIENDKRLGGFVRIGKNYELPVENTYDKRFSKFVRIGKDISDLMTYTQPEKRFSKFVRIGKALGLSDSDMDTLQKRFSKFVRIGKNSEEPAETYEQTDDSELDKRPSSFVRIGRDTEQNKDSKTNTKHTDLEDTETATGETSN